ncbi:MAG: TrkH family potassium uptake protein [Treponema sp.]|jgi:trk system potassium uptake protein TrkH|nr:TrkH family potassium uptake protein [Treponema sp.]
MKAFLFVFFAWVLVCLLGALPYFFTGYIPNFTDAVFESVSGFTTTGTTVVDSVEAFPKALIFWRAMTHWLGGMGIVVLTVALFPFIGAGAFHLFKAETPGPKVDKITPRLTDTGRILWMLYIILTAAQAVLLVIFGMDWFDAVVHSFSTMATGGFSSRNESIAYYRSPGIEWVCTVFMLLAGCNFTLIYQALRGKPRDALRSSELRTYGAIILVSAILITVSILPQSPSLETALRQAFFSIASILTTTGFFNADYSFWPSQARGVIFFLMFLGGCSGSTAGGVKVIRHFILWKQAGNEMKRIIYPRGVFSIQIDGKPGGKEVVYGVAGFVFLYFVTLFAAALLVSSAEEDIFLSLNISLSALGNIGLGLGKIGPFNAFPAYPAYVKWGLCFAMILGRLELQTVLVIFTRDFWRR